MEIIFLFARFLAWNIFYQQQKESKNDTSQTFLSLRPAWSEFLVLFCAACKRRCAEINSDLMKIIFMQSSRLKSQPYHNEIDRNQISFLVIRMTFMGLLFTLINCSNSRNFLTNGTKVRLREQKCWVRRGNRRKKDP